MILPKALSASMEVIQFKIFLLDKSDIRGASAQLVVVVLVAQSCPAPCSPMDCSPPGFRLSMEFSRQEYWSE